MVESDRRTESGLFIPQMPDISVISSHLLDGKRREAFSLEDFGLPKLYLVSNEEGLVINNRPERHPNSDALYPLDCRVGKNRVFVSVLPPNSQSSIHHHPFPLVECLIVLAGKAYLYLEGNGTVGDVSVILPNLAHCVITKEEPVVNLIVTRNAYLFSKDRQHIYHEGPDLTSLKPTILKPR